MNIAVKPNEIAALSALARHPTTQAIVNEEHNRVVSERQTLLDEIAKIEKEAAADWPKREKAITEAFAAKHAAELAFRAASDTAAAAAMARTGAANLFARERETREAALIAGADVKTVRDWKAWLIDESDALRRRGVLVVNESVDTNPVTLKKSHIVTSNKALILARLAALHEEYEKADRLLLEADQSRISDMIAVARSRLPRI